MTEQARLQELLTEGCREELGAEGNYDKCWKPAEFILWGKLIPPEGLGPRCYDHAAKHVGHQALARNSGYAVFCIGEALKLAETLGAGS